MAGRKKLLLPKNFEALLEQGDLSAQKAVFDLCSLDARGGYNKQTALAFATCPDDLARWLVAEGADIAAPDSRGDTPLHSRSANWRGGAAVLLELGADVHRVNDAGGSPLHAAAGSIKPANARLLLDHGADVDACDAKGLTPLEHALRLCSNSRLVEMASLAAILLGAGAIRTPSMAKLVGELGRNFEFHRLGFDPGTVDAASAALNALYALFDVAPVPRRTIHDGRSPIAVRATRWQDRNEELWAMLVPSSGAADTVQGEVIRIAGRLVGEWERNGGINWDADFKAMAEALIAHLGSGRSLSPSQRSAAAEIVAHIRSADTRPLAELAVAWVLLNPIPTKLDPPPYRR